MPASPYSAALKALRRNRVRFVVVGVSAINYYALDAGHMFSTEDFDLLLDPSVSNLLAALRVMSRAGFRLEAGGEPLGEIDRRLAAKIVEHGAMVTAVDKKGLRIDLTLSAGGMPYAQWKKNSRCFLVDGVRVPVGGLPQLLRAKERAGRLKDRQFLKLYRAHLAEMLKAAGE
ncbi:MAG: hypothetical protein HY922_06030 [Elusimicrobia bacterium]|nr:hypothetical protein [Elusimicrobiota bacterium]